MEDRYLYKAKRIDDGEWIQGFLSMHTFIPTEEEFRKNGKETYLAPVIEKLPERIYDHETCEVDPSTLCQCTGLRDKNGKLIWENDIIKYTDMITRTKKIAYIEWSNAQASFVRAYRSQMGLQYLYIDEFIANSGEVIGNKFDDVELLEVQDEENQDDSRKHM